MGNLKEIEHRHGYDRLRDAGFIAAALLLTALAIGSVTSKAVGTPHVPQWELTVLENNVDISR